MGVKLKDLDQKTVDDCVYAFLEKHKGGTTRLFVKILSTFIHFAEHQGWGVKLYKTTPKFKVQEAHKKVLAPDQVKPFLAAVDANPCHPDLSILVRLMLALGLREKEARHVRWEHFNWGLKTLTTFMDTKGGETIPIPMPDWLVEYLQSIRKERVKGSVYERGSMHSKVAVYAVRAGGRAVGVPGLSPHCLRATCATSLMLAGVDLKTIQKVYMRHKNIETTQRYLALIGQGYERPADRLAGIYGFQGKKEESGIKVASSTEDPHHD